MSTTKKVGYAYPTSPLANKLGKTEGCYYVAVGNNGNPRAKSDYISAWDTIQDAFRESENINLSYYRWSLAPAHKSSEVFISFANIGGIK